MMDALVDYQTVVWQPLAVSIHNIPRYLPLRVVYSCRISIEYHTMPLHPMILFMTQLPKRICINFIWYVVYNLIFQVAVSQTENI